MIDHPNYPTAQWRKSKLSGQNGSCVELATLDQVVVGVRDSVDPTGPVLEFDRSAVSALAGRIKDGALDL